MVNTANFIVRERCPLCGTSEHSRQVLDEPFYSGPIWKFLDEYYQGRLSHSVVYGTNYTIVYCQSCDFFWQKYILNDELMLQLYEVWIDPKGSLHKQISSSIKHRLSIYHRIAKEMTCLNLEPNSQPVVLDFGGGWGQWGLAAKALGCRVYLLELSEGRQQYNEQQGITCLTDLEACELYSFDLVNASQVFEHIPDPLNTLKRLRRLIKPGGALHIDTPNAANISRIAEHIQKGPFQPLEHINCFTPASLTNLLERTGFKPVECPDVAVSFNGMRTLISVAKTLILRQPPGKLGTLIFGKALESNGRY